MASKHDASAPAPRKTAVVKRAKKKSAETPKPAAAPAHAPAAAPRARVEKNAPAVDRSKVELARPPISSANAAGALGAPPNSQIAFVRSLVRDVPDFPKPGIVFKDITTLLASPRAFHIVLDSLAERFIGEHIDVIVGVEARGFIFGGALAARLNASFVPVRKPGKLPAKTDVVEYDTEYSKDRLEMHVGSISEGARVVIVDDVLATGGTARASGELVRRQGGYVIAYAFVIELGFLGGRDLLLPVRVERVIEY